METPLEIALFGPLRVQIHGQPLPKLRSRKALWLLAYLTLRDGAPVVRESLAFTFWPDAELPAALSSLRSVVSDLRQALGGQSERLSSPTRDTLVFDLKDLTVDVLQFDRAIRVRDLTRAVDLYQGDLLEGCPEEWAQGERRLRQEQALTALLSLAKEAAPTNAQTAGDFCRRAIAIDSLRDEPVRGLMNALASAGDLNGALHEYREFAHRLRREEGGVPDARTTELYERLRKGKKVVQNAPAETTSSEPNHIPQPLSPLVGREDETAEILATLRRFRIVSLVGVGGIGKTRLAIEVANGARSRFEDGVTFVSLEAVPNGGDASRAVAEALGVREETGATILELLVRKLRTKRALLVLDNCEHVMPSCAALCKFLLPSCGEVRLLLTSRESLRLAGESVYAVPGLPVPVLEHLPASPGTRTRVALGYESVALFVERAQSAAPQFSLDAENVTAVAEICARLEGIPLAIELAAVQAGSISVASIAKRLEELFAARAPEKWVPEMRQETMRSTLDWSYELLSEDERRLLRTLSVFSGGWTLDSAEAIAGREAFSLLRGLVSKSLVVFDSHADRYRFLEPVRQYASEKLISSGDAPKAQAAHRTYFVHFAEEAAPGLEGTDVGHWMRRLETEQGTLLAAMDDGEAGLRIADAMGRFWYLNGEFETGLSKLEGILKRNLDPVEARGKALQRMTVLLCCLRKYSEARAPAEEALAISDRFGSLYGVAHAKNILAHLAHELDDHEEERILLEECAEAFRKIDNRHGVAMALSNSASCAFTRGEYALARPSFLKVLALSEEIGHENGTFVARIQLASLDVIFGDYESAQRHYEECLRGQENLHSKRGVAMSLSGLGAVSMRKSENSAARELFLKALALFREVGDRQSEASVLCSLADLDASEHRLAAAGDGVKTSLALIREFNDRGIIASGLRISARISRLSGNLATAAEQAKESFKAARDAKAPQIGLDALDELGLIELGLGAPLEAVKFWNRSKSQRGLLQIPVPRNRIPEFENALEEAARQLGPAEFEAAMQAESPATTLFQTFP